MAARRTERAERARTAELTEALSDAIAVPSRPLPIEPDAPSDSLLAPDGEALTSSQSARQPARPTYASAYAEAQEALEEAFELAGVRDLFGARRFIASDSIRMAKRLVAASLNILRSYHDQEVMLEQTYARSGTTAGSLRESFETAEAGRRLLSLADSLFGLLLEEEDRYSLAGAKIRFSDPSLAGRYSHLRDQIVELTGATPAIAQGSSGIGATGRLRRVLGESLPPPVQH